MQERYEMAPGLWLALLLAIRFRWPQVVRLFAIHERTFYTQYRRIGPPKEALAAIRAELGKLNSANADP